MKAESSEHVKQLEQAVNYEYVKNILISYFVTNDSSVHANLLRVVFVAMKFTEEEQQRVTDSFNENNQSLMGRVINGFF